MNTLKQPTNLTKGMVYLRYALLFLFGSSIGTGGTMYFSPDKTTKEIAINKGFPITTGEKITPLNDDITVDEKQTLWRFNMVEISQMDTLRGKGLPTYIKADNTILQNIYVWTIYNDEPDKIYLQQLLENNNVTERYKLVNFTDPVKVKR